MQEVRGTGEKSGIAKINRAFKASRSNWPRPLNASAPVVSPLVSGDMLTHVVTGTCLGTHLHTQTYCVKVFLPK